jgi:gluconolactonase
MIKDGKLTVAIKDIPTPNGLAFSPDEKYLYANGSRANYIRRYDVQPDDTLTNSRLLIDLSGDKAPGITDGMRVDSKGDIYSTGPGGVWIISPEGKHLGTILTPEKAANLTFGDPDWKTVYIAAKPTIYKIRVNTPGLPCNSCSSK